MLHWDSAGGQARQGRIKGCLTVKETVSKSSPEASNNCSPSPHPPPKRPGPARYGLPYDSGKGSDRG